MCQLHIFNPSHDEALAANSPYYYPARAARTLGADLAALPAWWAEKGDWVLLPDEVNSPEEDFTGRGVRFVHLSKLKSSDLQEINGIEPWGWDPLLTHQLYKAGVREELLPSTKELAAIRRLSGRQTAVRLLAAIRQDLPETIGTSQWCTTEEEVWELIARQGATMLKAPWSSSGRGVFAVDTNLPDPLRSRVRRILKEQGAIEAEPLYRRLSDFALEFEAHQEGVDYKGLSVFATSETGAYTGNIVGEEEVLYEKLHPSLRRQLPLVIDRLRHHLHQLIATDYTGPLGVDLMAVGTEDGNILLHPCVEVNLRRTMGHVALSLRPFIAKGDTGIYSLRPCATKATKTEGELCLTPRAKTIEAVLIRNSQYL